MGPTYKISITRGNIKQNQGIIVITNGVGMTGIKNRITKLRKQREELDHRLSTATGGSS